MRKILTFSNTKAELFEYKNDNEVEEYHLMLHVQGDGLTFQQQLNALLNDYHHIIENELK